jgi:hypothetical protein
MSLNFWYQELEEFRSIMFMKYESLAKSSTCVGEIGNTVE